MISDPSRKQAGAKPYLSQPLGPHGHARQWCKKIKAKVSASATLPVVMILLGILRPEQMHIERVLLELIVAIDCRPVICGRADRPVVRGSGAAAS